MTGLPTGAEPREQLWSLWQHWMSWAVSYPERRRALAQLGVSDEDHAGDPRGGPQDDGRCRRIAGTDSRQRPHA
jgi:hypothetical protein